MAQSSTASTPTLNNPVGGNNATTPISLENQILAYSSLYTIALVCIIWGSIRSLNFVRDQITKKELIETSITTREAKKFPITASIVLFSLYLIFKINDGDVDGLLDKVGPHLPPAALEKAEYVLNNFVKPYVGKADNTTTEAIGSKNKMAILQKIADFHPLLDQGISYLPEPNKKNFIFVLLLLLCWEGCISLAMILKPLFSLILFHLPVGNRWPRRNIPYLLSLKRGTKATDELKELDLDKASKKDLEVLIKCDFDTHFIIALFFCAFVGISHLYRRHWVTNNLLGIAFSIYGIENLHLASFKAGLILLSGLFIYDVFWVFATDVMTTVAKGIDAPILLMFPLDLLTNGWLAASRHGMLGLGDIVIPGIFVALLHRFDNYIGSPKRNPKDTNAPKARYYYWITLVAYAVGLLITMGVMHHFKAAQPALLYLVPTCVLTPMLLALIRGEFKALWNYSEEQFVNKSDSKFEAAKEKKNK